MGTEGAGGSSRFPVHGHHLLLGFSLLVLSSYMSTLPSPSTRISLTRANVIHALESFIISGISVRVLICVDQGYRVYNRLQVCKGMDSPLYRFILFISDSPRWSSVLCIIQQAANALYKLLRPHYLKLLSGICLLFFLPFQTCHRN